MATTPLFLSLHLLLLLLLLLLTYTPLPTKAIPSHPRLFPPGIQIGPPVHVTNTQNPLKRRTTTLPPKTNQRQNRLGNLPPTLRPLQPQPGNLPPALLVRHRVLQRARLAHHPPHAGRAERVGLQHDLPQRPAPPRSLREGGRRRGGHPGAPLLGGVVALFGADCQESAVFDAGELGSGSGVLCGEFRPSGGSC